MPQIFHKQMKKTTFLWIVNVFLCLIIFYNAELSNLLSVKGLILPVSVVWPATGFSLAAILLFGYRIWPGIFFGNFLYNSLHLYFVDHESIASMSLAFVISFGSLAQAFLGGFIMRRFSSVEYFKTTKDIFIFLIPAGFLSCMIASTIGTGALYLLHYIPIEEVFSTWVPFWVGDTMGVYIFTPLITVWSLQKYISVFSLYKWETIGMLAVFVLLSILTTMSDLPLGHLFIPLSMWVTFRYRMHGATLIAFLVALVTLIPTALGYGTFVANLVANQLIILVSLLEIIVAISLSLAAVINEREIAWTALERNNVNLRQAIGKYSDELKEMNMEVFLKERLVVDRLLTSGLTRQIQLPLMRIGKFSKVSLEGLSRLRNAFDAQENKNDREFVTVFQNSIETIQTCMINVAKFETLANNIVKIAQEHLDISHPDRMKIQPIDINSLLNICLDQAQKVQEKLTPEFSFNVLKEYDMNCQIVFPLPESLAHAFVHIFTYAISSMKKKRDVKGIQYEPQIKIQTVDHNYELEVTIWDNGLGASEEELKHFFSSFVANFQFSEEPSDFAEKTIELGLSLAHDIITYEYRGSIKVRSEKGEFLQITVVIPKPGV